VQPAGGWADARARVTPTVAADPPRGLRGSHCARGGPKACHRATWCPLVQITHTQGEPAALRSPLQASTPRTRRAQRRRGPATKTPEELLREGGEQGMPRGRIVPACTKRAYIARSSGSKGTGVLAGRGGAPNRPNGLTTRRQRGKNSTARGGGGDNKSLGGDAGVTALASWLTRGRNNSA